MLNSRHYGNTVDESRRILREAYGVLRVQPRFLVWPFAALAATVVLWGGVAAPTLMVTSTSSGAQSAGVLIVAIEFFVVFFLTGVLWCWFNVALTYGLSAALRGESLALSHALKMASSKWVRIVGWVAFSATVGAVMRMVSNALGGTLGRIVQHASFFAWAGATYYITPILAFEELPVVDSLKRSATLLAKYPRVTIASNIILQIAVTAALLVPIAAAVGAGYYVGTYTTASLMVRGAVGVAGAAAVLIFFAMVIGLNALQSSVRVVLYRSARVVS